MRSRCSPDIAWLPGQARRARGPDPGVRAVGLRRGLARSIRAWRPSGSSQRSPRTPSSGSITWVRRRCPGSPPSRSSTSSSRLVSMVPAIGLRRPARRPRLRLDPRPVGRPARVLQPLGGRSTRWCTSTPARPAASGSGATSPSATCSVRDPDAAAAYEALKRRLAADHPRDIMAYVDGKTGFMREIEARHLGTSPQEPARRG